MIKNTESACCEISPRNYKQRDCTNVKGLFCTNPIYINIIDKVRQNPLQ